MCEPWGNLLQEGSFQSYNNDDLKMHLQKDTNLANFSKNIDFLSINISRIFSLYFLSLSLIT